MTQHGSTEIVVIGAACLDIRARPLAPVQPGTSNPAEIRVATGGSARNIAENLARLGVKTALLSTVGDDVLGEELLRRTAQAGVDVSRVLVSHDHPTSFHIALFADRTGSGYGLDDMAQLKPVSPDYVRSHAELISGARMVIVDGNLNRETVATILTLAKPAAVPVALDPAMVRRAYALRPHLAEFDMVIANRTEAEALLDLPVDSPERALEAARRMVSLGVGVAVITLAEDGLVYVTSEGVNQGHGRIPAIRSKVVDWMGARDALAAAAAYGLINQMPADDAMRLGIAAATLTLRSNESVDPEMSLEQLYANMVI